ncbi:MAG: 4'-phosphopantetheinyl transferase superfamily protein [Prevotella sp.]|nr:4'-phosphopantetheinyl transferase superfamily protein [Prevotella sp.]
MIYLNDDIAQIDLDAAISQLSAQRREQALRFSHELGRRQCIAAYLLLREALRSEYGIEEPPTFEYGIHGKPSLTGRSDIHFNLSHCRAGVICAVDRRPIGIDMETIRPYKEALARHTMNDDELRQIAAAARPEVEFIRLWTMKEALLKCTGEGITRDLKTVLTGRERIETTVNEEKGYVYSVCFS